MKKMILYVLCIATCVCLSGCKSSQTEAESDKPDKEEKKAEEEVQEDAPPATSGKFEVNAMVYQGTLVDLKCVQITKQGMEFECTNKSDKNITVTLDIALDGYYASLWSDASECEVGAGQTKTVPLHGTLDYAEHKLMSVYGNVFVDHTGAETIDICDYDLGGNPNVEGDTSSFIPMYANDNIDVKYAGADAQGILFSIENKRDRAIQVFMDSLAIEGQPDDIVLTASTVPAHATGVYFLDIYTYNPDYLPDDITAFDGVMFTQIATGGNGDRFQVTLSPESGN